MENVAQAVAPVEGERKPARAVRVSPNFVRGVLSLGAAAVLWEIAGRTFLSNPLFFAPLSAVLAKMGSLWATGALQTDIAISFEEFAIGFVLASVAGIAIGVTDGEFETAVSGHRPVGLDALRYAVRRGRAALDVVAGHRPHRAHRGRVHRGHLSGVDQHAMPASPTAIAT